RLAIDAVARHRLVRVGHREDPGLERDLVLDQLARIAPAVWALVVREDPAADVVELGAAEDPRADLRVLAHLRVLLVDQRPGFAQDRVRHADLPDVVQDAGDAAVGPWLGYVATPRLRVSETGCSLNTSANRLRSRSATMKASC